MALNRIIGPLKLSEEKCIIPIEIVIDGFGIYNPPVRKKLSVEVGIQEWFFMKGLEKESTDHEQAVDDLSLIAFYFLLRIGEYTMMYDNKQTRQFRLRDIVFFKKDKGGNLRQLVKKSTDKEIVVSEGATIRLVNNKIGHKNACIHREKWEPYLNPVRSLGSRYFRLRRNMGKLGCLISAFLRRG